MRVHPELVLVCSLFFLVLFLHKEQIRVALYPRILFTLNRTLPRLTRCVASVTDADIAVTLIVCRLMRFYQPDIPISENMRGCKKQRKHSFKKQNQEKKTAGNFGIQGVHLFEAGEKNTRKRAEAVKSREALTSSEREGLGALQRKTGRRGDPICPMEQVARRTESRERMVTGSGDPISKSRSCLPTGSLPVRAPSTLKARV